MTDYDWYEALRRINVVVLYMDIAETVPAHEL